MSWMAAFFLVIAFLIGHGAGYRWAHQVIAQECITLGGFYVGKRVFKCVQVEDEDSAPPQQ